MSAKKILICEDEPDQQASIERILMRRNYEVYTAQDGQKAIEKAKEIKPDVVFLDIRMPKIDGIEAAKQLRKFNNKTKIIFLTAFDSPQLKSEAFSCDLSNYIVKPTTGEKILKAVSDVLDDF